MSKLIPVSFEQRTQMLLETQPKVLCSDAAISPALCLIVTDTTASLADLSIQLSFFLLIIQFALNNQKYYITHFRYILLRHLAQSFLGLVGSILTSNLFLIYLHLEVSSDCFFLYVLPVYLKFCLYFVFLCLFTISVFFLFSCPNLLYYYSVINFSFVLSFFFNKKTKSVDRSFLSF